MYRCYIIKNQVCYYKRQLRNILLRANIYGIESSPAVRQNFDATINIINYMYLKNGHGDVVTLVYEQGNVLKSYEYDIYREILQTDGVEVDNPIS